MNRMFDIDAVRAPQLTGRRVVVPGGTGGVGEGVVRTWLRTGADVVVPTRDAEKGEALRSLLGPLGDAENLHLVVAPYGTFDEAGALAERIERDLGPVTDVVASIGGWWTGGGLWDVSEHDWRTSFIGLVTSHVAFVRAFVPRLPTDGTYSFVLGGSAYTPVPGSSIISMEQAALRMMNAVLGEEVRGRIGVHAMMLGPVATRQRSWVDPELVTADEVGYVSAAYAAVAGAASSETILRGHEDVSRELDRIGYAPSPVDASSTTTPSRVPDGWPALPEALEATVVTPRDSEYRRVRSSYMKVGAPHAVIMARTDEDVAEAVRYAADVRRATGERVPFSVRSGGHGIAGTSTNDDGVIVDLSRLDRVQLLDPEAGLVLAQAGASWGDVAPVLSPHDLVITSGNFGDTGVGGLATAGGVGYFARSQGLTLDRVRSVKLLTADGRIRWVDAEHEPDLFWAVRGGATQAGIALEFVFEAQRLGSAAGGAHILHQEVQYVIDDLPRFTSDWGEWIASAPREMESFLMVHAAGSGRFMASARNVWANDDAAAAAETLEAAGGLASVMQEHTQAVAYPRIVPTPRSPHVGQQRIQMRDVLVDHADRDLGAAMSEALQHPATAVGELRALGGAVADVPVDATAWAGRRQAVLAGTWAQPAAIEVVDESFAPLQAIGTGTYGAYSSDTRARAAELAWPGETGARLRAIADRVDPERLFDRGLVLPREAGGAGAGDGGSRADAEEDAALLV